MLSTDCSLSGDRLCDTSQPGGYCTIFNCRGNLCPNRAACVLFNANVQGCGFDDRSPSRTGRTFCMGQCSDDSDCRSGYVCTDPRTAPWRAVILDDNQLQRVCIVPPLDKMVSSMPDALVCGPSNPEFDAAPTPPTPVSEAGVDASADAGVDATVDAGSGASDAGDDAADAGSSDANVFDAADAGD